MRSIKAIDYDSSTVKKQEMQLVSKVVHQLLSTTKENYIQIPTGGTVSSNLLEISIVLNTELIIRPLKLVRVTAPTSTTIRA